MLNYLQMLFDIYGMSNNLIHAIDKLDLSENHPIFSQCKVFCRNTIEINTCHTSIYQTQCRKFLSTLERCIYDGLSKEKFFQNVEPCFEIYHRHNIHFFWATGFLVNYCKQDLFTILEAFKYLHGTCYIEYYDLEISEDSNFILTYEELEKIFDIHLIVSLAKIFSIFAHIERVVTESGNAFTRTTDFDSISGTLVMFKMEMGNYYDENPKAGFKVYYRKSAALKRSVMFSWKFYHKCLNSFFSMNDSTMDDYIKNNPEIYLVLGQKKKNSIINRKTVIKRFFVEENFFYLCNLLSEDTVTNMGELVIDTVTFDTDRLTIEL